MERIVRPFQDFAHKQSSGGILLIAVTVVAGLIDRTIHRGASNLW